MKQDMPSDASAPADCPPKPLGDVIAIKEGLSASGEMIVD